MLNKGMFFYEIIQKNENPLETNNDMLINFSNKQKSCFGKIFCSGRKSLQFNGHCMHTTFSCLAFRNVRDILFNIVARHYFIEFLRIKPSAVELVQKWIDIQNRKVFINSRSLHNILHSSLCVPSTPELVGYQKLEKRSNNHLLSSVKSIQNISTPQSEAEETTCWHNINGDYKHCTSKQNLKQIFSKSDNKRISYYKEIFNQSEPSEEKKCKTHIEMKLNNHKQRPQSEIFTNQAFPNEITLMSSQKKLFQQTKSITDESLEPIIEAVLQQRYFEEFLRSDQFWRYVMEVVSSSRLKLSDVLYSEIILGYFVEFVGEEHKSELLQCWLEMETFRQVHSTENATRSCTVQLMMEDALIIFNRFFRNKKICMNFSSNVKKFVKQNLSSSKIKLKRQAFLLPQVIAYRTLDEHFLKFLVSNHFYNFVTNLVMSGKSQQKSKKQ